MDPLDRFEFSQSSLQDYSDCPQRFHLRYIQRRAWPAVKAEPARENERHMQRGQRFHRLVQQYLVGVPEPRLTRMAAADPDENLRCWWRNFLESIPPRLNGQRHVEIALSAPVERYRLIAVFDLVLVSPNGHITIYDWKTSVHRPSPATLRRRMQSLVYPYLLVNAGESLNHGCPVVPEQVEMVYWFAEPGQPPERLEYNLSCYRSDGDTLHNLVRQIHQSHGSWPNDGVHFPPCSEEAPCRYCVYRSLCDRGISAGPMDGIASELDLAQTRELDLEHIAEIRF